MAEELQQAIHQEADLRSMKISPKHLKASYGTYEHSVTRPQCELLAILDGHVGKSLVIATIIKT